MIPRFLRSLGAVLTFVDARMPVDTALAGGPIARMHAYNRNSLNAYDGTGMTCVVLAFRAMPGRCCFLRVTPE